MSRLIASCVGLLLAGAMAQAAAQTTGEHAQHHPGGASLPQATASAPSASGGMAMMPRMEQHMKTMQEMHARMMAAKTPAERQALMAEQTKMMQDGMTMMRAMGGMQGMGDMGARMQMMEKRMEMMQTMMQSLVDRMAPPAGGN